MVRFRTLPDLDRWIDPRTLSDRTALTFSFQFISGLGTEIKMNIDINFSINVIHVLNIDINFGITEIHV